MKKRYENVFFKLARPVWADGREGEMNLTLGFRAVFEKPAAKSAVLKITASSLYRFFINGRFGGCGPARGPHGFYRVDEWDLSGMLDDGENILAVEVAGYNVNSYYLLDQPSFFQAELLGGDSVIAATGQPSLGFEAFCMDQRLQKVQRYSFQRTFIEAYRLKSGFDSWKKDKDFAFEKILLCETSTKNFISRRVPYPDFVMRNPLLQVAAGAVEKFEKAEKYWRDRALVNIGPAFKGYTEDELEFILSYELDEIQTQLLSQETADYVKNNVVNIASGKFRIFDFGNDYTGFIGMELQCTEKTVLYVTFDEILLDGDVDYKRFTCVNGIRYELEPGNYRIESMEPYTLKYLKLIVTSGQVSIDNIYVREYASADVKNAGFKCSNEKLNSIFEAGVETFRQNALDIFMDCPSRERAGWLCDSFFTSRVEYALTGKSLIEKNFLENYLLPEKFEYLPEGVLPMCYPADHNDGVFIPNWALWLVVQLEEYLSRSGDREMIDDFKERVYGLFEYFKKFRNEYGLLENLESWVFVEWSKANELIQDVNYPSNMLYSYAMSVVGHLYQDAELLEEAERLRKLICEQAYDGEFFVDNAVREDGILRVTENKTEVCQYYAFFFNMVTPETHPELWKRLIEEFGPERKETGAFPEVFPANAFMGNYMRLEILSRYGYEKKVVDDIENFFYYMSQKTGTLWEHIDTSASCNHGFASHVIHCMYRDALGIQKIDKESKVIYIKNSGASIDWCEGWLPVDDAKLYVKWYKEDGKAVYDFDVPEGYRINMFE